MSKALVLANVSLWPTSASGRLGFVTTGDTLPKAAGGNKPGYGHDYPPVVPTCKDQLSAWFMVSKSFENRWITSLLIFSGDVAT